MKRLSEKLMKGRVRVGALRSLTLAVALGIVDVQAASAAQDGDIELIVQAHKACSLENMQKTVADIRDCLPAVVKQSEAVLEKAEVAVRAQLHKEWHDDKVVRQFYVGIRDAFENTTMTFRAHRDAECVYVRARYASGNGGGIASQNCQIERNLARARELRADD